MPIAKEILSMFEFSRNPKKALSVNNHFDECILSQEKVYPHTFDASICTHRKPLQGFRRSMGTPL